MGMDMKWRLKMFTNERYKCECRHTRVFGVNKIKCEQYDWLDNVTPEIDIFDLPTSRCERIIPQSFAQIA